MKEYKVVAVSQRWRLKELQESATQILNSHASDGWRPTHIQQGFSGWLSSTLYFVLEREKPS